jgi:hypothetical protein
MNSSAISMTNTKIYRDLCPRVISTSAYFKRGRVSPDAVCRLFNRLGFLSGSPMTMSGQAMVTDVPVSLFTLHSLPSSCLWCSSCCCPSQRSRLTREAEGWGGDAGGPLFTPALVRFPNLCRPLHQASRGSSC